MNSIKRLSVWIALPVIGLLFSAIAINSAEAAFPEKPIQMIVPFGAGGGFDKLARTLTAPLAKELGVAVAIVNNPGAGGRRGSVKLFKSKPDGYTIGFLHFLPFMGDEIFFNKTPAVDYKKISVIQMVALGKNFIFVANSSPIKTFEDMKGAKRTIKFASTGIGSTSWIYVTALAAAAGFNVNFVMGYKSLPKAALAAARGDAEGGVGGYHQLSGLMNEIRPVLFFHDKRSPHFSNVPTVVERGFPLFAGLSTPYIVSAPPGTPEDRLKSIRAALAKAVQRPSFAKWAKKTGYILSSAGPKDTWKAMNDMADIFKSLVPSFKAAKEKSK